MSRLPSGRIAPGRLLACGLAVLIVGGACGCARTLRSFNPLLPPDPTVPNPVTATEAWVRNTAESILFAPENRAPRPEDEVPYSETVWLTAPDGNRLHARLLQHPQAQRVIFYCHGAEGELGSRLPFLDTLRRETQSTVFILDYRGYGLSTGYPSTRGAYVDVKTGLAYLTRRTGVPPQQMIFWGRSLGAAFVARLAAEMQPKALVLESTFSSYKEVVTYLASPVFGTLIPPWELNSAHSLTRYRGPVLITHGTDDAIVPYCQAEKLYLSAAGPRWLLARYGMGHYSYREPEYMRELIRFTRTIR